MEGAGDCFPACFLLYFSMRYCVQTEAFQYMNAAGCIKALCLAGRIILENGGETYRAEDTVLRMAQALGLSEADVFAVPSGLFISFTDNGGERRTSVSRVFLKGTHLARVDRINQISRQLSSGELSPDDLIDELKKAEHIGQNMAWWYAPLTAFLSAAGFAVMFGGGLVDMLVGGFCAALTQLVPLVFRGRDAAGMVGTMAGGILCALIPLWFQAVTGLGSPESMIASAIMPLVPGLSMTNAVQDIIRGDMVSGVAHCARAIMIAVMVAGGALVGTHVYGMLHLTAPELASVSESAFLWQFLRIFISSALAGAGFGALLYAPRKAILWGGLLGGVGYTAYWLVMRAGSGETSAMFVGALIASFGAQMSARKLKMIATVFVTIAIIPLVPGLGLYRAMSAFAQGQTALGGSTLAHAMALVVMIALGIGFGAALRKPVKKEGAGRV